MEQVEKGSRKQSTVTGKSAAAKRMDVKKLTGIGMLSAVAALLMYFEVPIPILVPANAYKLDFSELPVLIGAFAYGPAAGIIIEALKILIKLVIKPSTTAFVGELANFIIGVSLVWPAAMIYKRKPSKKTALTGMITGAVFMAVIGCIVNAYVLLPFFMKAFGMSAEGIIENCGNGLVTNLNTLVLFGVAPFNILKGVLVSTATFLLYKRVSGLLKR